jgi:hypothetical protein
VDLRKEMMMLHLIIVFYLYLCPVSEENRDIEDDYTAQDEEEEAREGSISIKDGYQIFSSNMLDILKKTQNEYVYANNRNENTSSLSLLNCCYACINGFINILTHMNY